MLPFRKHIKEKKKVELLGYVLTEWKLWGFSTEKKTGVSPGESVAEDLHQIADFFPPSVNEIS